MSPEELARKAKARRLLETSGGMTGRRGMPTSETALSPYGNRKGSFLPLSTDPQGRPQFDLSAGITGAIGDALTLPGDVVTGKTPMMTASEEQPTQINPEVLSRSFNLSTLASPVSAALRAGERMIPGVSKNLTTQTTVPGRLGTPSPTKEMLRQQAKTAYQSVDDSGAAVPAESMASLADDLTAQAEKAGIDPDIHPAVTKALKRFQQESKTAAEPKPDPMAAITGTKPAAVQQADTPLGKLDVLRQIIRDAGKDPNQSRVSGILVGVIDDFVEGFPEGSALRTARDTWKRMRKTEALEDVMAIAKHRAAVTGSGGNRENTIRQAIRGILDNPTKVKPFSKEERALMEKIVMGAPVQNLLRLAGKLSPEGNGLMLALMGGAAAFGEPIALMAGAAGMGAKRAAEGMTNRNVQLLLEAVRAGKVPVSTLSRAQKAMLEAAAKASGGLVPMAGPATARSTLIDTQ